MTRSRLIPILLALILLATLVGTADAQSDPRSQRDAARAKKAKLAAQLDELKASEQELVQAAAVLDDQVLAQAARLAAARQAATAAAVELEEISTTLEQTRSTIERLTEAVVERAVLQYMAPGPLRGPSTLPADDLAVVARREALLEAVAANDQSLLDQLRTAKEDKEIAQKRAELAKARAAERTKSAATRLAELEAAQQDKERIATAISQRQREVLSEIDEQVKADAELSRLIAERERRRAATPRPAAPGGSPSGGSGAGGSGAGGCIWPVNGTVTSEYGSRWGRLHAGIDIAGPIGTPIVAAKSGEVIYAGQQSGYGNVVMIDHGGGLTTVYAHMASVSARDGQAVAQGERVGARGNSGRSTGPHLHFETRYGGSVRNPRGCLG